MDTSVVSLPQDSTNRDDKQSRNLWRFFCYFLHLFLVALHAILLVISASNHPEHRTTLALDSEVFTTGLSGGLQAFYILYTALLVFVTQSLALSATFSSTKKLTQIHDICGAWSGLGAALSTLWSQTKVATSVWSVSLLIIYFACVSVLHVASSTIMQFQPFNYTITRTVPAVVTWPGTSVNLSTLSWNTAVGTLPFLQNLYGNTTKGLINSTLYDIPTQGFVNASVNATTVNAHCGLLTNLSVTPATANTVMSINVSMADMDPFTFYFVTEVVPLLNEFWFDTTLCDPTMYPVCNNFILCLVTAEIQTDGTLNDVKPVYLNGSYGPTNQNISIPTYFVACSLSTSTNTATLSSSGSLFGGLDEDPTDEAWSVFLPEGNIDLTSTISTALQTQVNPPSETTYCVPYLSLNTWVGITRLQAYMSSLLGLSVSTCDVAATFQYRGGAPLADYTGTPSSLTRGRTERTISRIATEFMWMDGELGNAGGGFDRQIEDSQASWYILKWRLNINPLPVITALCASVILCILVVCILWDRHPRPGMVSSAGVLELMWLGARSQVLRDHLRDERNTSIDSLRVSSVLETVFWPWPGDASKENGKLHPAIPLLYNTGTHAISPGCPHSPESPSDSCTRTKPRQPCQHTHIPDPSCSRRWCYALHTILASLHIVLLVLFIHHPEHSVVIPIKTSILTAGLSALLQAVYTLYSAILVVIMQRLALFRIVSDRRKLTTVHDVSGAWTGFGAAIRVLWQQRQVASSILEIVVVVAYLSSNVVLHIASSSVLQWQVFNSTLVSPLASDLAFPGSTVNISQLGWGEELFLVLQSTSFDGNVPTYGLSNNTLYDMPQVPTNLTFLEASVNATTLDVQCGLVPSLAITGLTTIVGLPAEQYHLNFSLNRINNGTLVVPATSKGLIFLHTPVPQCAVCPQTVFYVMTTDIDDVDDSVPDTAAVKLSYNYTSSSVPDIHYNWTVLVRVAACSVSAWTVPATLDLQENQLVSTTSQTLPSNSTSWSMWSPADSTDFSVGVAVELSMIQSTVRSGGPVGCLPSQLDKYIMNLLWTNVQADSPIADDTPPCPVANSSVKLSPPQLEDAIARTTARFLWLSGQLGESAGGFQRMVGESPVTRTVPQWRLNLNVIPIVFVSVASFTAFALVPFIIGKKLPKERAPLITGTSVLECLWLEAHSDVIHSRIMAIEEPRLDELRAEGMFDIALGDIGRLSGASEAVD